MNSKRPDPDALLGRLRSEEERQRRGKLKIFFGACPGVGKTYSMLQNARVRLAEGTSLLAGLVETHGRTETEALLEGIPILPRREVEYRGVTLREFDLDAALARKPALVLVDELAHTNAPGARHAKRFQDVQELLGAGIDVYTTINVQHIESLNDIVAQITSVRVRETVPDSILEEADEIVLVDLPPEELLKRLAEGKVYVAEQAAQAAERFFQKSNLIVLRELSLRFMTNRVNVQVLFARRDETVDAIWPTAERLLVCVGPSPSSAKLIRATRRLAAMLRAEWIALTIETPALAALAAESRTHLAQNQRLAERLGGETISIAGDRMPEEVIRYARARNVTKIIVGKPIRPWWRERLMNTVVDQIVRLSGDIDVYVIRGEGELQHEPDWRNAAGPSGWMDYGYALLVTMISTLLAWLVYAWIPNQLSNLIMVYLAGITVTAMRGKQGPSMLASLLSVLLFDVLFVDPRFTIAVSDITYLPTFAVMLVVGLLISTLTLRLRRQVEVADKAALRLDVQRRLGRELSSTRGDEALRGAARLIAETGQGEAIILMPDAERHLQPRAAWPEATVPHEKELAVAQWAFDHGAAAGSGTDTLASAEYLFLPLRGAQSVVGALGLRRAAPIDADLTRLLESLGAQLALALEVERLAEEQRRAVLNMETERMRSSILSAVSHDLRTPLASIMGSSESLLQSGEALGEPTRRALLQDIHDETERLSRLIANLLEMTRLEGGGMQPRRDVHPVEEIVGSTLHVLARRIEGRELLIDIPADLPAAEVDSLLIQHVFQNVIENALDYAPPNRPIEIRAHAITHDGQIDKMTNWIEIEIADRGPGLAPGEEARIFEKFFRGHAAVQRQGAGLGLAICRGIVELHGGAIRAENRNGGGLSVRFTLPVAAPLGEPAASDGPNAAAAPLAPARGSGDQT